MSAESTITYLEMLSREELQPAASVEGFELMRIEPGDAALNRRFYDRIWDWTGRKEWTGLDWQVHVERETLHTLVGRMGGEEIGFAELEVQPEAQVKFHYFGLLPEFVGRGLGGAMLTASIRYAWENHPKATLTCAETGLPVAPFRTDNWSLTKVKPEIFVLILEPT